ncbi:histone-lysine N-methyltransferase 2C-like [Diaphorina citri]|uniref:Histone-lysine N-methyltransferase 2C-like n=1 Tax=Diaphorina citri TaxID=121845 RepID=A0A3Q0JNY1_DIACI|nr:histone-lysine N-methyltransferase 2C-like [Diaphorina citri]
MLNSGTLVCNLHLDQVPLLPNSDEAACGTCSSLGDVNNILMCSKCGQHYHGLCVGLAVQPGMY